LLRILFLLAAISSATDIVVHTTPPALVKM
jgi:hypothetical protein